MEKWDESVKFNVWKKSLLNNECLMSSKKNKHH